MEKDTIQRSIVLPKKDLEELNLIAKKKFLSVNDVIREAIREYIKSKKANASK